MWPTLSDVRVDSFRFLPRSFRAMFESPEPLAGETDIVWAPLDVRLAEARIALLSSAGFSVRGEHEPFDAETERQQPFWEIPRGA